MFRFWPSKRSTESNDENGKTNRINWLGNQDSNLDSRSQSPHVVSLSYSFQQCGLSSSQLCRVVTAREQVRIGVHCHRDRPVPHAVLQDLRRQLQAAISLPVNAPRSIEMAQGMKARLPAASSPARGKALAHCDNGCTCALGESDNSLRKLAEGRRDDACNRVSAPRK